MEDGSERWRDETMHICGLPVVDGGGVGLRAVEEVGAQVLGGQVAPRVEHAAPHVAGAARRRRRRRRRHRRRRGRRHRLRPLVAPRGSGVRRVLIIY